MILRFKRLNQIVPQLTLQAMHRWSQRAGKGHEDKFK